jgi:hydroxylysine kinase
MNTMFEFDPLLGARGTSVSCLEAEQILREHFGIEATATALSSERDRNFRALTTDGTSFLLKISNPAEDPSVTNLQTAALRYLEDNAPNLPVPRLVATSAGEDEVSLILADGRRHIVRLMSFLSGRPLALASDPWAFRSSIAGVLAELDLGLRGFEHHAADHELLWDASNASRIRPLLACIEHNMRRELATRVLDEYEAHSIPKLPTLRTQIIHNDFNPSNILVSSDGGPRITGIIDFGDVIRAPLICDLATAAAYQSIDDGDPLAILCDLVVRYHDALPLTAVEIDVFLDLVRARQLMIVVITEWRAERQPENRDYILRNNPRAWHSLEQFGAITRENARRSLRRACGLE